MRLGLSILAALVSGPALAVDILKGGPDSGALRGSIMEPVSAPVNFAGIYAGALAGQGVADIGLRNVGRKATRNLFRNTLVESRFNVSDLLRIGEDEDSSTLFGGFVGINYQYEDVVWGFELDYTRGEFSARSSDSIARRYSYDLAGRNFVADVDQSGVATAKIEDIVTLRGRAGYVMGSFMPFLTGGLAIAKTDVVGSAVGSINTSEVVTSGSTTTEVPYTFGTFTSNRTKKDKYNLGVAGGLGIDIALIENVFLRAEYQFLFFPDMNGAEATIHNARIGGAIKF